MLLDKIYIFVWILTLLTTIEGSWYLQSKEEATSFLVSEFLHDTILEGEEKAWSKDLDFRETSESRQSYNVDKSCADFGKRSVKRTIKGGLFRISLYRTRYPMTACRSNPCKNGQCSDGGHSSQYTCKCNSGWTSKNCDIDIDECQSSPCHSSYSESCTNLQNAYRCNCKPGYTNTKCQTEIDECGSSPCQHGGTCNDTINAFSCNCAPGYTGSTCEIDIDECESSPCQNGATCEDRANFFKCKCAPRYYGVLCDTGICRPLPADVVFVLDSSVSMTQRQFNKQLEFVSNFSDEVKLGHRDFQISVITYSFDAHIEFYLEQYRENVTLKEAIANITYKPGVTNTHLGLEAVNDVFGHSGNITRYNNTMADRFVYLMTDGMASKAKKVKPVADYIKQSLGASITAIGIGNQVLHEELYQIASKQGAPGHQTASVYSVQNFNSLYTVLKELVHYSCDECTRSKKSDVAILLDTSFHMTDLQVKQGQDALVHIIDDMEIGENEAQLSFTSFDDATTEHFGFSAYTSKTDIIPVINNARRASDRSSSVVDIADVINYVRVNVLPKGRNDSRSFIIVVTNGDFCQSNSVKLTTEKQALALAGVETIVIGTGDEANFGGLLGLATDPFDVYIANEQESLQNLDVMKSYFEYSECSLE